MPGALGLLDGAPRTDKDFFRIGDATDPTLVRELIADRKIDGIICANDFIAVQVDAFLG